LRIFHPEEDFGTESGSGYGGGDYGPSDWRGKGITEAAAECEVDAERDEVGESFEEEVRVDFVMADGDVDRELRGEME
jgi:hypothetical protein